MMVPSTNEIDSGAASSMTTFVDEHDKLVPSTIIHSPHQFENIEKQEDSDEESSVSVLDSADFDDESWGFFMLEAILYIPMLMQSVLASMNFARSLLFGEAVMLFLEKRSFHAPWWLQRCQSVFLITNSNVWPPPSFLLLIALTIIALVVHPDGFTWVILRKTRNGVLSLAEMSSMWWDIFVNEHGAIISSMLALTTFAALFFLAYVLQKTLSPRKPPETATSDKKKTLPSGKPQPKKKKRKGGCSRINHRLGRTKSTSESHDGADRSPTRDESELGSTSTGLSSPTLPHQESQQRQEISQQNFSDNSPVYSSALKPSSDLPENVAHHHISPVSNSSISREGSLSTSTTESCRTPNTRQSSHGATDSTKSEDLQRDLARSAKGGNRAYSATQSNSQHAGRKKNTRRGTARKLSSNDTYSKQTYDAPNCQVGTGSQRDTLKSSLAVFRRTVESHERQGSNCSVSRSVSATKSRNSVRAFPTISSQNEIKSSQMSPSKEYARLSATSLANEMQPSRIVSPHPALHYPYHDGAPGVSFSQTNLAYDWSCQTKQRPAADTMDESRGRSRTDPGTSYSFVSNIPPPPGLSLPTGVNTNATIDMPLLGVSTAASIGGSSLPMVSTAQSHPYSLDLQEADLHDITMRRCLVKENPFEMSSPTMTTVVLDQNEEDRIDAELQELGGRMVGSILDF